MQQPQPISSLAASSASSSSSARASVLISLHEASRRARSLARDPFSPPSSGPHTSPSFKNHPSDPERHPLLAPPAQYDVSPADDQHHEYSVAELRRQVWDTGRDGLRTVTEVREAQYEAKARLVGKAMNDIGMGRYNWQLFAITGLGWMADNIWMHGIALSLPSLSAAFSMPEKRIRYTTTFLFLGLSAGSFVWGLTSDILGRRRAFRYPLPATALAGLVAAAMPSWPLLCAALVLIGSGVGGSLPVDGAVFLEFLPAQNGRLLTLLSVWWPAGQIVAAAIGVLYFGDTPGGGPGSPATSIGLAPDNTWRGFIAVLAGITAVFAALRLFIFDALESPKFLISCNRDADAVAVIHDLALRNRTQTWLSLSVLNQVCALPADVAGLEAAAAFHAEHDAEKSVLVRVRSAIGAFSAARIRPLFRSRRLGLATALIWFVWAMIGMGYPLFNAFLPQYLSHSRPAATAAAAAAGPSHAYRNYLVTSLCGIPASVLAAWLVDMRSPFFGRRGTLAISTLLSAVFLFLFVQHSSERARLQLSCAASFVQNIMYGVLYAYTPELFPAPVRGVGTGVASFLNRSTGLLAPVVAANLPGDGAAAPVILAACLISSAFVGIILIPVETRGTHIL